MGVGAAGDGETDQVHRGRGLGAVWLQAEHDGSDLAGPHSAFGVQGAGQRLARVVQRVQVRQQGARVDEDGVAPEGDDDRHSRRLQRLTEVGDRPYPVAQVVMVGALGQALGDRLQVAAGEPAVGGEALGEDFQGAALLGQAVVVEGQPAADVGQGVLLGRHRHPVGQGGHLPDDAGDRDVGVAGLDGLDEPRVLREPARIQEQRLAVPVTDVADGPDVGQADRLAAAGIVRHGQHHQRDMDGPLGEQPVQRRDVHVALERVPQRRLQALRDEQVDGLRPGELDVGPGGVEVGVVRDDPARAAGHGEQDLLRGPALVRGQDVPEREQAGHRRTEPLERGRPRVRLIAALHPGPLLS